MARISYDERTAAAFKAVREVHATGSRSGARRYDVTCARRRE